MVLEGVSLAPFKLLESASKKFLILKIAFMLAITSLKRVGDLQALSISPPCLEFAPGRVKSNVARSTIPRGGRFHFTLPLVCVCLEVFSLEKFRPVVSMF